MSYKKGEVAIIGRPNVGKSTLLNALVKHKVAIVSQKPQTTRSQIVACYEDERGQIFFLDTPGYYEGKGGETQFHAVIKETIKQADVVVLVMDKTRDFGDEDERVWRMIEYVDKPLILLINKNDINKPDFSLHHMAMIGEKAVDTVQLSALNGTHLHGLIGKIFEYLPEGERDATVDYFPSPLLSQSGSQYLEELIREKVYRTTGQEVPYVVRPKIDEVDQNEEKGLLKIKARLLVPKTRYKGMLIGKDGRKVREIRMMLEKELRVITQLEVRVSLKVEVED